MKTKQNLSDKFANAMLNNFQLNSIRGGEDGSNREHEHEIPPVIIPPTPPPPPRR